MAEAQKEAQGESEMMDMKNKYHVRFSTYEHGLVINALNRFRTDLIEENRDPAPVNEVLVKVIQAKSRRQKRDREAR